jgi:hypothetical protein
MYWVDVTGGGVAGYKVEVVVLRSILANDSDQDVLLMHLLTLCLLAGLEPWQ